MTPEAWLGGLHVGADGLVPVVVQDSRSGDVLMLAFANVQALELTRKTGLAHFYSRSRARLWQKGETSGNVQRVMEIRLDCDTDAVLYRVQPDGPACHTGARTCFGTAVRGDGAVTASPDPGGHVLTRLAAVVAQRDRERPSDSYTAALLAGGTARVAKKVGEEATETVVAATSEDDTRLASEAADLLYHLLVLLQSRGVPLDAVWSELERRGK